VREAGSRSQISGNEDLLIHTQAGKGNSEGEIGILLEYAFLDSFEGVVKVPPENFCSYSGGKQRAGT